MLTKKTIQKLSTKIEPSIDTPTGEPRGILLSSPDCSVFMELPPTVSRIASQQY
ncbi:hypothetical protein PLAN_70335 [Planktothrix rubescens CCAP 1459/22]|uniref:Uncharacterized protein n=1 Tax=Planktothrix rubescens CCAP 1459/22 TaxID=329571 RepID=A0A6J7ZUV3_PLARU|nr:hypothetical protein PLAN_70335 [Planktothrix rubescens NIVA-CYA 18]